MMPSNGEDDDIVSAGYEAIFSPELDRKYVCPVCLGAMRNAMQTSCGHRFCEACILEVVDGRSFAKCPVDNMWFRCEDELFPDNAVRREILSLTVKCHSVSDGCTWIGELRDLQKHWSVCGFVPVMCEYGCAENLNRGDVAEHHQICQYRPVNCRHCGISVIYADIMRHQVLVCAKFPVQCTLCGQSGIQREDIQRHLDMDSGDCPHVIVSCSYQKYGCQYQDKRQSMKNHETEAAHIHLGYMEAKINSQEEQINAINQKMLDLTGMLDHKFIQFDNKFKEITELQMTNYNGKLHWKITRVAGKEKYRSTSFYTGCPGYKLHVSLEFLGHIEKNETYVSLFVTLEKGKFDDDLCFPFNATCEATVLTQDSGTDGYSEDIHCTNVPRCRTEGVTSNSQRGRLRFMLTDMILSDMFCKDNCIYIDVNIKTHSAMVSQ